MRFARLICAILLSGVALAQSVTPRTALDAVIDDASVHGFSGVVIVGDVEGATYQRLVPNRANEPRRMDELWRWASVTKQITAILIMQEVEKRHLLLDAVVTAYLPEFKGPTGDDITLRDLLRHTSGLPNSDDDPNFYTHPNVPNANRTAALGYCAGPVKAQPGEGVAYNNCDYLVLGAVLEAVAGQSFAELVARRIAEPAGASTLKAFPPSRADAPETVGGVTVEGQPEPAFNFATFGAAGSLYGSPGDLLRVDVALMLGRYLTPASMITLWSGTPSLGSIALGAWSYRAPLGGCGGDVDLVERRGEIGSVQVRNIIAPKLGRILIVFSNGPRTAFGEVWQGSGLTYDLLNAAFCTAAG